MNLLEIVRQDVAHLGLKVVSILIFLATAFKLVTLTFFDVGLFVYMILNTLAIGIWIAKEVVIIDLQNGVIKDGYKILVFISGETTRFSGLEKIFINKIKMTETFRHLATTTDIHHVRYKAFLKTDEGDKICIGIDTDKDRLADKLREFNKVLKTVVFDTTGPEATQLDG